MMIMSSIPYFRLSIGHRDKNLYNENFLTNEIIKIIFYVFEYIKFYSLVVFMTVLSPSSSAMGMTFTRHLTFLPPFSMNTISPKIPLTRFYSSFHSIGVEGLSRKSKDMTFTPQHDSNPIRVAFQGEAGAYSEKALRELFGPDIISVSLPNFESCYCAVDSREVEYTLLPVENSLGGSIHENYDLMLRYDLTIVAEHECRVSHCLLALPGVKREDVKYCLSHPQALAQCDGYLRSLGITPVPMYDTAGSAKLLSEYSKENNLQRLPKRALPDKCTASNTAAIASDLAGNIYALSFLDRVIEDDDTNYTRFLLLGCAEKSVSCYLGKNIPAKTSIVFTLANTPGALYKALACFSLRDINFSKIESRPTSTPLWKYLKLKRRAMGHTPERDNLPRFRYCFYLDFLTSECDERAQNALHHLREQVEFCRILGSYPQKSRLVGPVYDIMEVSKYSNLNQTNSFVIPSCHLLREYDEKKKLNIGIVGYGTFGQFIGKKFAEQHVVRCIDPLDRSHQAELIHAKYFPTFEINAFLQDIDVIVLAVPLLNFEDVVSSLPVNQLHDKLVVEVCSLSAYPKRVLLQHLGPTVDLISANALFGQARSSHEESWEGLPLLYERVRISHRRRADLFLGIFERARCQLVQMTADQQDIHTADAEFVTQLTGQLLDHGKLLPPVLVASKKYTSLCDAVDVNSAGTFDDFYGLFLFNDRAKKYLNQIKDNLSRVERWLAAKEAYLAASASLHSRNGHKWFDEYKQLLSDAVNKNVH